MIEALNRAYGVDTIGLFLDSPRCPDFVEGMFYEDSLPVFQIRGDTAKARRILEASAGSGAFRLEADTEHTFTQKELKSILDTISNRFHKPDGALKSNMNFWGMGNHTALVSFKLNTPAARQAFRKHIIDSPAVSFEGPESPMPHSETGVSDTLGISLRPEYPVYSTQTSKASLCLSTRAIEISCVEKNIALLTRMNKVYGENCLPTIFSLVWDTLFSQANIVSVQLPFIQRCIRTSRDAIVSFITLPYWTPAQEYK